MRSFVTTKFDGVISLLWVLAWSAVLYASMFSRHLHIEEFMPLFIVLLTLWWGVGLLFAVSALRRGSPLNFLCGLATLIGFVAFLRWFIFPVR